MQAERRDGDGWVDCACGQRHWGTHGAAGILLYQNAAVLLQHRAPWSHQGGTWGVPGGARRRTESAVFAALREAFEEAGVPGTAVDPTAQLTVDHGTWSYTTVVAEAVEPVSARRTDPESVELRWVPVGAVADLPLHPGLGATWPRLRDVLGRRLVLVVDAANVVGSRADGWWRDRAGATARLAARLGALASVGTSAAALGLGDPDIDWWPDVLLVAEGAARSVADPDGVVIRRAASSGDDEIVAVVAERRDQRPRDHIMVVTADRNLRSRVASLGATTVGPRTLYSLLDAVFPS
jgi:8-oxo-dGTP diphosphatase